MGNYFAKPTFRHGHGTSTTSGFDPGSRGPEEQKSGYAVTQ